MNNQSPDISAMDNKDLNDHDVDGKRAYEQRPHLVVEVVSPLQRQSHLYVIKDNLCRIGRAWDNDIILQDERAPIQGGELSLEDGRIRYRLDDERGNQLSSKLLNSGDSLQLGKSLINVYSSDHPVSAFEGNNYTDRVLEFLGRKSTAIIMLLSYGLLFFGEQYLRTVRSFEMDNAFQQLFYIYLWIFGIAFVASFFARFLRQERNFLNLLGLICLSSIIQSFLDPIYQISLFNFPNEFVLLLSNVFDTLLVGLTLWGLFRLTTNWSHSIALSAVIALGSLFLMQEYVLKKVAAPDFRSQPEIFSTMMPASLLIREGIDSQSFIRKAKTAFAEADKLRTEEKD